MKFTRKAFVNEVCNDVYRLSFDGDDMFFNVAFESDLQWFNDKIKQLTADGYIIDWSINEVIYQ
jgi:hypothetical protein